MKAYIDKLWLNNYKKYIDKIWSLINFEEKHTESMIINILLG